MIRLRDAGLLAFTKLRIKRLRTLIAVLTSGVLFALLLAALLVSQGVSNSISAFYQEGLNSRYIVAATTDPAISNDMDILHNPDIRKRAGEIYTQTVVDKTAAAKKLGMTYDPESEPQPLREIGGGQGKAPILINNIGQSPAVMQAVEEYAIAHPAPGLPELKAAATPYSPTHFYSSSTINPDGTLITMNGGTEIFNSDYGLTTSKKKDLLQSAQLSKLDSSLTSPFILPTSPTNNNPEAVPLVISYAAAEQLLGLPALPKSASSEQHSNRVRQLYGQATSIAFSACYRNNTSAEQIKLAIAQADEHNSAETKKAPLVYTLPAADSCSAATIATDNRSAAEKTRDNKQQQFDAQFTAGAGEPKQQKIDFRVVGLYPDQSSDNNTTISNLLQTMVGSSLGGTVAIPSDLLGKMPNAATIEAILFPSSTASAGFPTTSYFVEFATAQDAGRFIEEKSCTTRVEGTCATATRQFQLHTYGSNSVALGDAQQKFTHIFTLATIAASAIAIVILGTTIGRMVADGRRETAVYRAIGAKRIDIIAVYGVYTLCLAFGVALFALVAGILLALGIDAYFWREATMQAQLLFGASNSTREFRLFAVPLLAVGSLLLVAIIASIVSAIWPLIRNIRRNPIGDMREE